MTKKLRSSGVQKFRSKAGKEFGDFMEKFS
jgi:hypothetical protein